VTWTYQVDAAAVEYLTAGQRRIEAFNVTIVDGHELGAPAPSAPP
jgi:VCBS repeat-containing protein